MAPRPSPALPLALALLACSPPPAPAEHRAQTEEPPAAPSPTPAPEPATRPTPADPLESALAGARRLAAGDLDGDGSLELVVVGDQELRVLAPDGRVRAQLPAPGGIQLLELRDLDHDGRAEILAAWGFSPKRREARARASLLRLEGELLVERQIAAPETERPQFVALTPFAADEPELLVGHFTSKYMVELARARQPGEAESWQLEPFASVRMATSLALGDLDHDGREDLVIGRVYGEQQGEAGDAFLLRPEGERVAIPITGGVRSLLVVDLDGDGRDELLIGDGWDRDYGRVARARLTRAWWTGEAFESERLDPGEGQYTLWELDALELDARAPLELLTRGNAEIQLLGRSGGSWQARNLVRAQCSDMLTHERADGLALLLACEDKGRVLPLGGR